MQRPSYMPTAGSQLATIIFCHPATLFALFCCALLLAPRCVHPQQTPAGSLPTATPRSWIVDAAVNEAAIVDRRGTYLRYHTHRIDAKGDIVRDVIETPQGAVARIILRNGHRITPQEDLAEQERLKATLNSPVEFARHHRHDDSTKTDTLNLVKLMPDAMLYSYAPGQPQLAGVATPQVVLDFKPNPAFHPPTIESELLTGLEGRIWIDSTARRMVHMEARVIHPINLILGLAHVYPGGKLEFEQTDGDGVWVYSHLVFDHVTIREVLFKTAIVDSTTTDSQFEKLPAAISYQEAIQRLLDTPLPAQ